MRTAIVAAFLVAFTAGAAASAGAAGFGSPSAGAPAPAAPAPPVAAAPTADTVTETPKATWVFQAGTGTAYQFQSRLVIEQDGEEDLDFSAEYSTNPFTSGAPYYSLRIGRWQGSAAWEVETHHHLVTLANGPPEVGSFSITHGYNLNTVNRAWLARGFVWRLGAGAVVTHPESVVRGRTFDGDGFWGGFYLSGVCGQAGVEKRLWLGKKTFVYLEGKATAAWAKVPVEGGHATVPNYALHGIAGVGYGF